MYEQGEIRVWNLHDDGREQLRLTRLFDLGLHRHDSAMKLTPELLAQAPSSLNTLKQRELDLRGTSKLTKYIQPSKYLKGTKYRQSKTWV